ncbi:MAG: glycosyltransferase [Chitinophagaceae bacterium]
MGKKIIFTIFNDTSYDQRMIRICNTLAHAGYDVLLVGRRPRNAIPLVQQSFRQKRLRTPFYSGFLLYAVFNIRLFLYLLFQRADAICAIDLDTILPCYLTSVLKKIPRIYDAHELFCEMKEIVTRPAIYKIWKRIEKFSVPAFVHGYTVNKIIADEFNRMYSSRYEVIRSIALFEPFIVPPAKTPFIIYQGAVNEGRSFETLIPAMQWVMVPLHIYGDGNFMDATRALVEEYGLQQKVIFKGKLEPRQLKQVTREAVIGITLFDDTGASNYFSLANRFFDYMQAGIPQLCVAFPAYQEINNLYEIAVLIADRSPGNIARQLNEMLTNRDLYNRLAVNCGYASQSLNWQNEEKKLVAFYKKILS